MKKCPVFRYFLKIKLDQLEYRKSLAGIRTLTVFFPFQIRAKQPRVKGKKVEEVVTEKGDKTDEEKKENARRRKAKEDEVPKRRTQAN